MFSTTVQVGTGFEIQTAQPLVFHSLLEESFMPVKQHTHKHPEVDQRVKALEAKTKKLEKAVSELQSKLKTHDHPHTH